MRDSYYVSLISGERRGVVSQFLRGGLLLAEPVYGLAVGLRNLLFDWGLKKSFSVPAPVISIGNLTTGGTGKTPTVAWLIKALQTHELRPVILSRGYQSLDGEANDEKRLLEQLCPQVPHLQNKDRVQGAQDLIEQHQPDVIVLDDGFQHRRLNRNFNLVLIDALNPWGYNHLLPRGLLRESLRGLKRSHAVMLTRCDQVSEGELIAIVQRLKTLTNRPIYLSQFQASRLVDSTGKHLSFAEMNGKRTCSFAGIGNPAGFRRTLTGIGLSVSEKKFMSFPDHHHYCESDLQKIKHWATEQNAEALIVTRKDLVKLNTDRIGPFPLWAVDIELKIPDGQEDLLQLILKSANR